jgi:hypothetical protein
LSRTTSAIADPRRWWTRFLEEGLLGAFLDARDLRFMVNKDKKVFNLNFKAW